MAPKTKPVDAQDAVKAYVAGESCQSIARRYGVTPDRIRLILKKANVPIRDMSESRKVMWDKRDPAERRAVLARTHAATVGRMSEFAKRAAGKPKSTKQLRALAHARWENLSVVGTGEELMASWLAARGLVFSPQLAVDRYNLDLALLPVAVEIHVRPNNPLHFPPSFERMKHLTNRGWHVVYLWVTKRHFLSAAAADDIVTFYQIAKADPSPIGQYRVIRGSGELVAAGRGDLDEIALIPTPRSPLDGRPPLRANPPTERERMLTPSDSADTASGIGAAATRVSPGKHSYTAIRWARLSMCCWGWPAANSP